MFADYVSPLSLALARLGWRTAHAMVSSSLIGWGTGSVVQDAAELKLLAAYLEREHGSMGAVVLGHSTGCQDAVQCARDWGAGQSAAAGGTRTGGTNRASTGTEALFFSTGSARSGIPSLLSPRLLGVILQAPVSDREAFLQMPECRESLAEAEAALARGEPDAFVRTIQPGVPLSARRAHALLARNGADDMFSVDFNDDELGEALHALRELPSLLVLGSKDLCYPPGADVRRHAERMREHAGKKARAVVLSGDHSLRNCEDEFVDTVIEWIKETFQTQDSHACERCENV